jgi:hypothetical protein
MRPKRRGALASFDSDTLTLYKVDLPYSADNCEEVLKEVYETSVKLKEDQKLGFPLYKLQEGGFPNGMPHIVVVRPAGELINSTKCQGLW